jgi:hypothetical protein
MHGFGGMFSREIQKEDGVSSNICALCRRLEATALNEFLQGSFVTFIIFPTSM